MVPSLPQKWQRNMASALEQNVATAHGAILSTAVVATHGAIPSAVVATYGVIPSAVAAT